LERNLLAAAAGFDDNRLEGTALAAMDGGHRSSAWCRESHSGRLLVFEKRLAAAHNVTRLNHEGRLQPIVVIGEYRDASGGRSGLDHLLRSPGNRQIKAFLYYM
jgi:hypothetical protein